MGPVDLVGWVRMEMVFPYFLALTGVSVLSITISAIMTYRHRERSTIAGALVVVGAAFWLMMDALQLASNSLSIKLFFYMMRFVGLVFVPSGWFVLALLISGYERYVKPRNTVALAVVPFLTLLLDFTNQSHGLMWSSATQCRGSIPSNRHHFWARLLGTGCIVFLCVDTSRACHIRSKD